jgi:hypothetical protein
MEVSHDAIGAVQLAVKPALASRVNHFSAISRAREARGAIETDPRAPPTSFERYRFGANVAASDLHRGSNGDLFERW